MKIAAYCRVSTDKADQLNSLEAQNEFFSEYTQRTGCLLYTSDALSPELYRKNFGNTFKRLDPNRPALTMVPGNDAFPIHPTPVSYTHLDVYKRQTQ